MKLRTFLAVGGGGGRHRGRPIENETNKMLTTLLL